jgi:hypothetical protein
VLKQVFARDESKPDCFNGNVGCKGATLGLPTLRAMANLDGCKMAFDGEANAFAQT